MLWVCSLVLAGVGDISDYFACTWDSFPSTGVTLPWETTCWFFFFFKGTGGIDLGEREAVKNEEGSARWSGVRGNRGQGLIYVMNINKRKKRTANVTKVGAFSRKGAEATIYTYTEVANVCSVLVNEDC